RPDDRSCSPLLRLYRPIKEGDVGAWTALGVSVEEMICADVVLVDGALHETHAERLSIETMILANSRGNGREVVNAEQFHGRLSIVRARNMGDSPRASS